MMSMRFRTEHQRDAFFLIIIVTIAAFLILTGGWMYMIAAVGVAVAVGSGTLVAVGTGVAVGSGTSATSVVAVGSGAVVAVDSGAVVGGTDVAVGSSSPSHSTATDAAPPPQARTTKKLLIIVTIKILFKIISRSKKS